jgi:subtilisin family serine protease
MNQKISKALTTRLSTARDYDQFQVIIFLNENLAKEYLKKLPSIFEIYKDPYRMNNIKERCNINQKDLSIFLRKYKDDSITVEKDVSIPKLSFFKSFWINNSIVAHITLDILKAVVKRPDVKYIDLIRRVELEKLLDQNIDNDSISENDNTPIECTPILPSESIVPNWNVARVGAPLLWQKGIYGSGITVAIMDSGVNYEHPDLIGQMWDGGNDFPNHGYDFGSNDYDPFDERGHGTACAGIIAGNGSEGKLTGIAPGAKIMAIRIGGFESQIWDGFQFAIDQGAHIINMSITAKFPSEPNYPAWRRTCETVLVSGLLHANSVGNEGNDLNPFPIPYNIGTPGNCPPPWLHPLQTIRGGISSAIGCGATDISDTLVFNSGKGPAAWEDYIYDDYPYQGGQSGLLKPDICAPGPGVESCNWLYGIVNGARPYIDFGGTSASTPHIAGCLALLAEACIRSGNEIISYRVQEAIEMTAVRIPGQIADKENHYGSGRIDIYSAYNYGFDLGWWA